MVAVAIAALLLLWSGRDSASMSEQADMNGPPGSEQPTTTTGSDAQSTTLTTKTTLSPRPYGEDPTALTAAYEKCLLDAGFDPEGAQVVIEVVGRPYWVKTGHDVPAEFHRPCLVHIGGEDPLSSSHGYPASGDRCEAIVNLSGRQIDELSKRFDSVEFSVAEASVVFVGLCEDAAFDLADRIGVELLVVRRDGKIVGVLSQESVREIGLIIEQKRVAEVTRP